MRELAFRKVGWLRRLVLSVAVFGYMWSDVRAQSLGNWKLDYWFDLSANKRGVSYLSSSSNGDIVVSAGSDKVVNVWNSKSNVLSRSFKLDITVSCVALSPSKLYVAAGSTTGNIYILDLANRRVARKLKRGVEPISALTFSQGAGYLIVTSTNGSVQLWDVNTFRLIRTTPKAHDGPALDVVVSNDNNMYCTVGSDGRVRIWKIASGGLLKSFVLEKSVLRSVAFSPDNSLVACANDEGLIVTLNTETGARVQSFKGHVAAVTAVGFSQDGNHLVSSSWDETLRLWDVKQGKQLFAVSLQLPVTDIAVLSDGSSTVVSGGWNKKITFWKIKKMASALMPEL